MTAAAPTTPPPVPIPDRPPELRGGRRDAVRLVVSTRAGDVVTRFRALPALLRPGDLLVVNDSRTLPASLPAGDGTQRLHLSTPLVDGDWVVEVRLATRHGSRPFVTDHAGRVLPLPDGGRAWILAAHPRPAPDGSARLWRAHLEHPGDLHGWLHAHGRPIRYGDPAVEVPLSAYQTLFAHRAGSAEMPSAARPFTRAVVRALRRGGVGLATITLHTGVSSQEVGEPPYAEPFEVPGRTVARVAATRRRGGRVVAVGTTVARALETVADDTGRVAAASGWTDHVIGPDAPVRVVDALVTGWHEPGASHLDLLTAVAGEAVLARAYERARTEGIQWHEFGDSHLLVP